MGIIQKLRSDLIRQIRLRKLAEGKTLHWCPIVSSHVIKKAIVERCNELGVSMMEICIRADVSWYAVKNFYLKEDEPMSRPSIRAEEIIRMGALIGINVRVRVFRLPANEIDTKKLLNEKFIPHAKRKKNKKLG